MVLYISTGDCAATIETGVRDVVEVKRTGEGHTDIVTERNPMGREKAPIRNQAQSSAIERNQIALDITLGKIALWAARLSPKHNR